KKHVPPLPDSVLWWSFYEREASFPAFVREALQYASGGQANPAALSLFDQIKSLKALLAQKRLLLVLDGFERELRAYAGLNAAYQGDELQPDGDARACINPYAGGFLQWIASAPLAARVLLTSRLHPRESRWPRRLPARGFEKTRSGGLSPVLSRARRERYARRDSGRLRALWIPIRSP